MYSANGKIIGPDNKPTFASANGIFKTSDAYQGRRSYSWPTMLNGGTPDTAAPSGYHLAQNFPGYSSGWYWIKSPSMPNPLQMYVDMTEEGGGYDFYFITSGTSVTSPLSTHSGTALGLDIVMPRSKYHWRAMSNVVQNYRPSGTFANYFTTAYGIYRSTGSGSYTGYIMRDPVYYVTGAPDWRVKDGGRWWLRDTAYSEPNGDYSLGCFLSGTSISYPYGLSDLLFNDNGSSYATGSYYLVSTNLKP